MSTDKVGVAVMTGAVAAAGAATASEASIAAVAAAGAEKMATNLASSTVIEKAKTIPVVQKTVETIKTTVQNVIKSAPAVHEHDHEPHPALDRGPLERIRENPSGGKGVDPRGWTKA